jgi:hypothetical protein
MKEKEEVEEKTRKWRKPEDQEKRAQVKKMKVLDLMT